MFDTISVGYPTPSSESVSADDARFYINGTPVSDDGKDEPFSYYSEVTCDLDVDIDLPRVLRESGYPQALHTEVELAVSLIWFSSATKQRGSSAPKDVVDGINSLSLTLDGTQLGGDLTVHCVIFVKSVPKSSEVTLYPSQIGSIMWQSEKYVLRLEGEGARFTIAPLDFKAVGLTPTDSMWRIEFTGSIVAPAQSAIMVYINSGNKYAMTMLEKPNTRESKLWHAFLETDVITQMLIHGTNNSEELSELTEDDEGSLGESIMILFNSMFPGQAIDSLQQQPTHLAAAAQAFVFRDQK